MEFTDETLNEANSNGDYETIARRLIVVHGYNLEGIAKRYTAGSAVYDAAERIFVDIKYAKSLKKIPRKKVKTPFSLHRIYGIDRRILEDILISDTLLENNVPRNDDGSRVHDLLSEHYRGLTDYRLYLASKSSRRPLPPGVSVNDGRIVISN